MATALVLCNLALSMTVYRRYGDACISAGCQGLRLGDDDDFDVSAEPMLGLAFVAPAEGEDDGAGVGAGYGDVGEEAGVADGMAVLIENRGPVVERIDDPEVVGVEDAKGVAFDDVREGTPEFEDFDVVF